MDNPSNPAPVRPVPLRRNAQFQLLWIGSATSTFGSQISTLAFPLLILVMTGSGALAGIVGATSVAASVAMGFPAGALVDRWDRRRTLLVCEAARMAALGVVALAVAGGWASVPLFLVVAVIQGAGGALVYPVRATTIRRIVPEQQLPTAYAQEEARAHGAALLGPPAGGALFAIGHAIPFLADAVSYLVSFTCAAFAKIPRHPAVVSTGEKSPGIVSEVREGLRWLRTQRSLRAMLALLPVMNIAGAGVSLLTILLLQARGVTPGIIGLVMSAEGVAGLLGSLAAAQFARTMAPGRLLVLIVWLWAVLMALLSIPLGTWWVAVLLGFGVLITPTLGVVVTTHIARITPEHLMGRTTATVSTVAMLFNPLGPLAAGILAQAFGPTRALIIFSIYLGVCALVATVSRALRTISWPALGEVGEAGEAGEGENASLGGGMVDGGTAASDAVTVA